MGDIEGQVGMISGLSTTLTRAAARDVTDHRRSALIGGLTPRDVTHLGDEFSYIAYEMPASNRANILKQFPPNSRGISLNCWSPYRIISRNTGESEKYLRRLDIYYLMNPSMFFGQRLKVQRVANFWNMESLSHD